MGPVVDQINHRFKNGGRDNNLGKAGVLIHHFDSQGNAAKPWLPCPEMCWGKKCWCADIRDRVSASLINALLPKGEGGRFPTYADTNTNAAAGFVLSPAFTNVFCAYPSDGGSAGRTCDPIGESPSCTTGCGNFDREGGGPLWCDQSGGAPNCAFRPNHLTSMLQVQRDVGLVGGQPTYNEIIVDRFEWQKWHPKSIEAVWYLKNCGLDDPALLCEPFARQVHNQLLLEYGVHASLLPLLVFDPSNWVAPFTLAPTPKG
jgi:hypothetical protein